MTSPSFGNLILKMCGWQGRASQGNHVLGANPDFLEPIAVRHQSLHAEYQPGGVGWLAFCVPVAECLGTEAPPVLAKISLARAGVSVMRVDSRKSTPAKRSPLSCPPWGSFRQHHYRYPEDSREEPRQRS